jgi:ABC-2 type transport system permease protein
MRELLSAEWTKLRHRWMPRVLLILMLIILGLLFWGTATDRAQRADLLMPHGWMVGMIFASFVAPFLWPVLGGSWAGNEYGWGTIRMVLSRRPNRIQFVLAGLIILSVFVALSLVITVIFSSLAALVVALLTGNKIFIASNYNPSFLVDMLKVFLASWYVLLFYLAVAYAAGTLFRSAAVGIGVGIGATLADLIITGIFFGLGGRWQTVAEHFPGVYTRTLPLKVAAGTLSRQFAHTGRATPGIPESILALALYTAIPVALALVLVRVRDVTS